MIKHDERAVSERIETHVISSITKLPGKIMPGEPPLSEKLLLFESQQAYIESLNLREVCFNTFSTLQESINKVQQHFDPNRPIKGDDIQNYQLLLDVTEQRNFLTIFNQNFRRVTNHVLELSTNLSQMEKNYVEQIESLSK